MNKFIYVFFVSLWLAPAAQAQMTISTDIVLVCDFEAMSGTFTNCVPLDNPAFFTIDGQNGWIKYTTGGKTEFFFIKRSWYDSDSALSNFDTESAKHERFIISVGIATKIVAIMGTDKRGTFIMNHHIVDSW